MMNRVFYISGPMEGKDNHNKEEFDKAEKLLKSLAYGTVNPFYLQVDERFIITEQPTRQDYYRKDIRALTYCTDILMLRGWNTSHGAQLERLIAIEMGLNVVYEEQLEDGKLKER